MSEMVERVKEAMLRANEETIGVPFTKLFEIMARAAIAAIREPTEAMVDAPYKNPHRIAPTDDQEHREIWRAMIDAALK